MSDDILPFITEADAKAKRCPYLTDSENRPMNCLASGCMAWKPWVQSFVYTGPHQQVWPYRGPNAMHQEDEPARPPDVPTYAEWWPASRCGDGPKYPAPAQWVESNAHYDQRKEAAREQFVPKRGGYCEYRTGAKR